MATKPNSEGEAPLIFEWIETAGNGVDFVLKPISGANAFRKYNILLGPAVNRAGNLRGMVINARMRSIYMVAGSVGSKITVISVLLEVSKEYGRIQKIVRSNASLGEKTSHVAILAGAAALRGVTSIVPQAVHWGALSVEGYAKLYSATTGFESGNALADRVESFDRQFTEIHSRQWDGENWYNVVTATIQ